MPADSLNSPRPARPRRESCRCIPPTHPAIQSALARIGEATKQATIARAVLDHGAAGRAARQRPRAAEARVVGHRTGRAAAPAIDRRADAVRSARQRRLARVPVAAGQVAGRRARHRRRGQGVGRNRQQGDHAHRDRLRRSAARARRHRRQRDVGPHPHRPQGRKGRARTASAGADHAEHDGARRRVPSVWRSSRSNCRTSARPAATIRSSSASRCSR